jgi:hypothetical protein
MVHVFECRRPTLPTVSVTVDKDGLVNTVNLVSYGACYHRFCNMRGATTGAGIAYPSGAPEFTPGFSGVRVTRSLVLCVCFVDRCLSFCTFSFCYCVVFSSWIYRTLITCLVSSNSSYPITSSVTVTKIENFSIVIWKFFWVQFWKKNINFSCTPKKSIAPPPLPTLPLPPQIAKWSLPFTDIFW